MAFSTRATVEFEPDDRSLRQLRSTVEDRVGSVTVNAQTDGGRNKPSFTDNRASRERAMTRNLLSLQLEKLGDIEDAITKQAFSDSGGGGGGGLLATLGLGGAGGLAGTAGLIGGSLAGSGLLGNPGQEGTLSSRLGDMGAGLVGGEDFANMSGDERREQTYEQIRQATKGFTEDFSSTVSTLTSIEWPSLPKLEAPDLPELSVPDLPTLDLPELPKLEFKKPGWISSIEKFLNRDGGGSSGGNFGGSVIGADGLPTMSDVSSNIDLSPNLNFDFNIQDIRRQIEQAFRNINLEQIVENIVRNQFGSRF